MHSPMFTFMLSPPESITRIRRHCILAAVTTERATNWLSAPFTEVAPTRKDDDDDVNDDGDDDDVVDEDTEESCRAMLRRPALASAHESVDSAVTQTTTVPPPGVNLMALESKFRST